MKIFLILVGMIVLLTSGCSERKTHADGRKHMTRTTVETPTADGGKATRETLDSWTEDDSLETNDVSPQGKGIINTVAGIAAPMIGAATGTPGMPWQGIIEGVAGIALTGYAAMKHSQANTLKDQMEYHKADAKEGWDKALEKTS